MIFNAVNFKNINFLTTLFLISIIVISWVYTIFGIGMDMSAWKMTLMEYNQVFVSDNKTTMKDMKTYTFSNQYFISLFFMWTFMMIAMMLPTAYPVFVMYNKIYKERKENKFNLLNPIFFITMYMLVWSFFSFLATLLQIILLEYNSFNLSNFKTTNTISSILFIFIGIYQLTPLKNFCLYYCRNPIEILSKLNFNNLSSQFTVSYQHALFCLGCCWALMLILFSVGVMNLLWISIIAIYVFFEKNVFRDKKFDILVGLLLIMFGIYGLVF